MSKNKASSCEYTLMHRALETRQTGQANHQLNHYRKEIQMQKEKQALLKSLGEAKPLHLSPAPSISMFILMEVFKLNKLPSGARIILAFTLVIPVVAAAAATASVPAFPETYDEQKRHIQPYTKPCEGNRLTLLEQTWTKDPKTLDPKDIPSNMILKAWTNKKYPEGVIVSQSLVIEGGANPEDKPKKILEEKVYIRQNDGKGQGLSFFRNQNGDLTPKQGTLINFDSLEQSMTGNTATIMSAQEKKDRETGSSCYMFNR